MTDPIPDKSNRVAWALGYIFHPFVLFVPGAYLVSCNGREYAKRNRMDVR
jgi:hypothetical protein